MINKRRGQITYLPLRLVHEILSRLSASKEQESLANFDSILSLLGTFLNESTERGNTSSRANHDDGLTRVRGQLEVGVTNMDRNVNTIILVARTHDFVALTKGCGVGVTILLLLQGQEIVGGNAAERITTSRNHLGLNDGSDGNLLRLDQRRGRDGVVTRLELGNTFDKGREGNLSPLLALANSSQETRDVVVMGSSLLVEIILVVTKSVHLSLDLVVGSKGGQGRNKLTGNRSTDLEVVPEDSIVGRRVGEGDLGSGFQSLDSDDFVLLCGQIEDIEETGDLIARVGGPDSNVISSLVPEVRTANVDFHVEAVSVLGGEQFPRLGNRRNVGVVGVERSLGTAFEVHLVGFAEIDFGGFGGQVVALGDSKGRLVHGLTLLEAKLLSQSFPHGVLPGQKVLFHGASAVVTLTSFADAVSAELLKSLVDVANHRVVVLVGVVAETESDVVEVAQRRIVVLGEAGVLAGDEFVEVDSVIGGLSLTVGSEDEHDDLVAGNSVEIVKIVFFKIGDHGIETESALAFLGETRSIVLSGTGLGSVEDDAVLARLFHLLNDVPCAPRPRCGASSEAVGIGVLGDAPYLALGKVCESAEEDGAEDDNVQSVEFSHDGYERVPTRTCGQRAGRCRTKMKPTMEQVCVVE